MAWSDAARAAAAAARRARAHGKSIKTDGLSQSKFRRPTSLIHRHKLAGLQHSAAVQKYGAARTSQLEVPTVISRNAMAQRLRAGRAHAKSLSKQRLAGYTWFFTRSQEISSAQA